MNRFQGYVNLLRLERAFSAAFGVLIAGLIPQDMSIGLFNVYAFLCVFFSAIANFVLNDIHDQEIDAANNRVDRPIASGLIKPEKALRVAVIAIFASVILASRLPNEPRLLVLIGLPASLLYNVYLKRFILLKNLFTGLANSGVVLVGAAVSGNVFNPLVLYLAVLGFLFSFSYEVMLDMADTKGDALNGVRTFPNLLGVEKAKWISIIIGALTIFLNPLPYFINYDHRLFHDPVFLVIAVVSMTDRARVLTRLQADQSPENVRKLKKHMFRNLQISGLGYLIGILI